MPYYSPTHSQDNRDVGAGTDAGATLRGPASPRLGITTKIEAQSHHSVGGDDERASRKLRYLLQDFAGLLVPEHRVAWCLSRMGREVLGFLVKYSPSQRRAFYKDLIVCGSVWDCPVCSAAVAEVRRDEVAAAIKAHKAMGGRCLFLSLTFRHDRFDKLADMREAFTRSMRALVGNFAYREVMAELGAIGAIRVVEVTWGRGSGWHPHAHILVFIDGAEPVDAGAVHRRVLAVWRRVAARHGLGMNEHGLRVQETWGAVEDYVAKYGREPLKPPWGVAEEMARANTKLGRISPDVDNRRLTPFQLLSVYAAGDDEAGARFREYSLAFKGTRQMWWSAGLRERLGLADVLSDQAAAEVSAADAWDVAMLSDDDLRVLLATKARARALSVVESHVTADEQRNALLAFLGDLRRVWWLQGATAVDTRVPDGVELAPESDDGYLF